MNRILLIMVTILFFSGCTHVSAIKYVNTPLELNEAIDGVKDINLEINNLTEPLYRDKIDVESLKNKVVEALEKRDVLLSDKSNNLLELDMNKFMIWGSGFVFCHSNIDFVARVKINDIKKVKRFIVSKTGYFCVFGDKTKKMEQATKEALEEVLNAMSKWIKS